MKWWKALGMAAFVGVAATGVAVARAERQRRSYTPEQVRERLHARAAEIGQAESEPTAHGPDGDEPHGPAHRLRARLAAAGASAPVAAVGRWLRGVRGSGGGGGGAGG